MKRSALFMLTVSILAILVALALFAIADLIDGPEVKNYPPDNDAIKYALARHAEAKEWR